MIEKNNKDHYNIDIVINSFINIFFKILSTNKALILFDKTFGILNDLYFNIESLKVKYNSIDITNAKRDFLKYYINEKNIKIGNYIIQILNFNKKHNLIYEINADAKIVSVVDPLFDNRFKDLKDLLKYFKIFREGYLIPKNDLIQIVKYIQNVTRLKVFL